MCIVETQQQHTFVALDHGKTKELNMVYKTQHADKAENTTPVICYIADLPVTENKQASKSSRSASQQCKHIAGGD